MQHFAKETIIRLAEAQVEFVVVGGISAVLQGVPIVTVDLDICYRRTPANITKLVAALRPLNPRARGLPPELPFIFDERTIQLGSNFTLEVGDEHLDLLGVRSAIGGYEDIIGQASDITVAGYSLKVLSLEQLIATKRAAGRPKDFAAIPTLEATLKLQRQGLPKLDEGDQGKGGSE